MNYPDGIIDYPDNKQAPNELLSRKMKRACPTIQELLAFDAVARYESVTLAAKELCISISGVSKQIAGLESYVGKLLFVKNGRGVALTAVGREYWRQIAPNLRAIEAATLAVRAAENGDATLIVASVPTFLARWLIPRLTDFRRHHPSIAFSFRQHVDPGEIFPADVDGVISHAPGGWPNVICDYITGRDFVCIRSPELELNGVPQLQAADMLKNTLLHLEHAPLSWRSWAAQHGLDEAQALAGPRFAQYSAVIQAVVSGLGIGLVPWCLVEKSFMRGQVDIIRTFAREPQGHYLCYRPDRVERPVFRLFRAWLLDQGRRDKRCPHAPGEANPRLDAAVTGALGDSDEAADAALKAAFTPPRSQGG